LKFKKTPKPRSGDSKIVAQTAVAASRLKNLVLVYIPWADAHGYLLPPLRGSGKAQIQKA
jgi:hypothetical protein